MYAIGTVLFFSVIGLIPLFGYTIAVSQERIKNGVNTNPPDVSSIFSLTGKGIIGLGIIVLMLVPSGLIYILMPILISSIEIGESMILSIFLIMIAIAGFLFALSGLYLFSAMIFAYCRYSVDERLNLKDAILYTTVQVSLSRKYFNAFVYIMVLSILYGILTQLLFLSVILAPLAGVLALIYFSLMGYVIGSLTTEFRTVQNLPFDISDLSNFKLNDLKELY
jgi:hypothetical protein